jgi:hypothetical protein
MVMKNTDYNTFCGGSQITCVFVLSNFITSPEEEQLD